MAECHQSNLYFFSSKNHNSEPHPKLKGMRPIFVIAICIFVSILVIVTLYVAVPEEKILQNNGFERKFKTDILTRKGFLDLKYNSYYIAGLTNTSIFLGNYKVPTFYLHANYTLTDTIKVDLNIPNDDNVAWNVVKIVVNSPNIYISDRLTPVLFHSTLPELTYSKSNLNGIRFGKMVPFSSNQVVVRTFDPIHQQNVVKAIPINEHNKMLHTYVLEKQVDGVFCTDGFFLHSKKLEEILYVYYYRNQYVGLNSKLDPIYIGNTIDTVSNAEIEIETITSENRSTVVKRPDIVNKRGAVYEDKLLIHSGLIADNESIADFKDNSVIDVYSLKDQSYRFSFYLPAFKKEKVREFKVYDDKLVVIYSNYLVTYDMKT